MSSGNQLAMEKKQLFRAIDVWRRTDDGVLFRYRCFEVISAGKFCVQSRDSYKLPFEDNLCLTLGRYFLELLAEESPDSRASLHDSIEEAIRSHDVDFSGE